MNTGVTKTITVRAGSTEPIRLQLLEASAGQNFTPTGLLNTASDVQIRFYSPRTGRRWGYSKTANPSTVVIVDPTSALIEFRPAAGDFVENEEPILMRIDVVDVVGRTHAFPREYDIEIRVAGGY